MINLKEKISNYDDFVQSIIKLTDENWKNKEIIKYGKPTILNDKYILNSVNKLKIVKENKDTLGGYVYSIFDSKDNLLYIGSTRDVPDRLRKHLKSNGTFKVSNPKGKRTDSVIDEVYNHLVPISKDDERILKYNVIKIEPWYFYTTIESLLIDVKNPLWNK